eukprot:38721-Rhodomonas_salina.1
MCLYHPLTVEVLCRECGGDGICEHAEDGNVLTVQRIMERQCISNIICQGLKWNNVGPFRNWGIKIVSDPFSASENASAGVSLKEGESLEEGREELLVVSEHGSPSEERGEPDPGVAEDIRREVEGVGEVAKISPHKHAGGDEERKWQRSATANALLFKEGKRKWEKETGLAAFPVETREQWILEKGSRRSVECQLWRDARAKKRAVRMRAELARRDPGRRGNATKKRNPCCAVQEKKCKQFVSLLSVGHVCVCVLFCCGGGAAWDQSDQKKFCQPKQRRRFRGT